MCRCHLLKRPQSLSTDARRVNVSAFCLAYEFDIVELERALVERFGSERVHAYPEDLKASQTADIVHARYVNETGDVCGDVFCFEARPAHFPICVRCLRR